MNTENNLLQTREEEGGTYDRTLVASEFIDWLLQEGEMGTRAEAEQLGRRLLEHGIVQHGEVTAPGVKSPENTSVVRCRPSNVFLYSNLTQHTGCRFGQFWAAGH